MKGVIAWAEEWAAEALRARARCQRLAVELQLIMGRDRGRMAAWCCRVISLDPRNPGYETLLRWCRRMALAGWFS